MEQLESNYFLIKELLFVCCKDIYFKTNYVQL